MAPILGAKMDAEIALRLIAYTLLLLMSGFFSGSETALFGLGEVDLRGLEERGHPRVTLLRRLLSEPRRLIATIFIGNELVNIGASTLLATVTDRYMHEHGQLAVTTTSTVVSVFLILMLGELTPKNLAVELSTRWATVAARPIAVLSAVMAPLRWGIERIADVVVRLIGDPEHARAAAVGEEEFRTLVDVVRADGDIDESEYRLINNIFDFGDRRVTEVMTAADAVFAVSEDIDLADLMDKVRSQRFSRIPVYRGHRDRVVGVLHAKDLVALAHRIDRRQPLMRDLLHTAMFVPKTTMCRDLFRDFRRRRNHLALVVDEYGSLVGLLTIEDLLEEMFGEIKDEKELPLPSG